MTAGIATGRLALVDMSEIEEYPLTRGDRLNSHFFMVWERRRWLNSDMRLKGRAECRALYFDLINIACDQSPVGTIPNDMEVLAKLLMISESELRTLCQLEYGPLHKWQPCRCGDEVRLMHPVVLDMLIEAVSQSGEDGSGQHRQACAAPAHHSRRSSCRNGQE